MQRFDQKHFVYLCLHDQGLLSARKVGLHIECRCGTAHQTLSRGSSWNHFYDNTQSAEKEEMKMIQCAVFVRLVQSVCVSVCVCVCV